MNMDELARSIVVILERSGFDQVRISAVSGTAFDLVARRGEVLLLVKVAERKEDLTPQIARELKVLASMLKASPLVVMPSSPAVPYHDGVLYLKNGLPLMTLNTLFDHLIEQVPPMVYYSSGGHYVNIDGEVLRKRRDERGISLGTLADHVRVTRRAIQMYEEGMGVDMETALRMEAFLDTALIRALDPFRYDTMLQGIRDSMEITEGVQKEVLDHLGSIGMEVVPTTKCPFDALARAEEGVLLASLGQRPGDMYERAKVLHGIGSISRSDHMMVVDGPVRKRRIDGTPVLNLNEVKSTEDAKHLLRLVRERQRS
ncbi:MAG: helix-turn-helix domain-containing protein [Candidatus Thermoplasmatota archaeon]|nr:helix-turn-helix domain-containing protein [Candidatus Thermoplasmatota archaeon]